MTDLRDRIDESERRVGRQSAGTSVVRVILGSLTVMTATLTLYRFIESRGARERQAYFNSLTEDLAEMLEKLSDQVREQDSRFKKFQCRYDVEQGNKREVDCEDNLTSESTNQQQLSEAMQNSPEAQMWFKGLENNRNFRRLSDRSYDNFLRALLSI